VLRRFQQLQISIAILKHPRLVKLGTLFFATIHTLKQTFLLQQGHKKETQKKLLSFKSNKNKAAKVNTTGLPLVKRFLYSHIAKFHTLFLKLIMIKIISSSLSSYQWGWPSLINTRIKIKIMIHHLFKKWRKHQVTSYLIGLEPIINILYFCGGGGICIAVVPTIIICT
jgi:hypothetical protein